MFQVGVTGTLYLSSVKESKSYGSLFMPRFSFDYAKYSDNLFWASIGVGLSPRIMTIYKYQNGTKIGLEYPEFWARVRTGLKLQGDFITNLPHLGLGIAINGATQQFTDNGNYNTFIYNVGDSIIDVVRYRPFIELSNTIINSTYRDIKRNLFMSYGIRYYPLPVFQDKVTFQYDFDEYKTIQNNIIEIYLSAGLQRNIHHTR
jgi:hypothetical protein